MHFVRFQAARPAASGRYPGVFALANDLAGSGRLSEREHRWWRDNNDWFERELPNPGIVAPTMFDRDVNPHTSSWFRTGAERFLLRTNGYLDLLDAHGVAWVELRSDDPGPVLYSDPSQVVVAATSVPPGV